MGVGSRSLDPNREVRLKPRRMKGSAERQYGIGNMKTPTCPGCGSVKVRLREKKGHCERCGRDASRNAFTNPVMGVFEDRPTDAYGRVLPIRYDGDD
jgi:predicted amidophosphoribosyltransferase